MIPEQPKQKIVAETTSLMHLKIDNTDVIKHTFTRIREQVLALLQSTDGQNETYRKAFDIIEDAMHNEYKLFSETTLHDEKEQALIQLRHKAADVCTLLQTV